MWPMGLYLFVVLADDDECTSGEANCDRNAKCINTLGSYKCDCVPGYSGDGYTCRGLTLLYKRSLCHTALYTFTLFDAIFKAYVSCSYCIL